MDLMDQSCVQYKKGYTSYGWLIQISNQSDIKRFSEKIGFTLPSKVKKLKTLLSSYKLPPRLKVGAVKTKVMEACSKLREEGKEITIEAVAQEIGRSREWVAEVMRELVIEEKLIVIKQKTSSRTYRGGFTKKLFDLSSST